MTSVTVMNGPNLNLLGTRKPEVYGSTTLADVERMCRQDAEKLGLDLIFLQSNHEGQLVDWIHETGAAVKAGGSIGAVYNPGAHTHYSYAIARRHRGGHAAGDRTAHIECSCQGGVSASFGDLTARARDNRRVRCAGLFDGDQRPLRDVAARGVGGTRYAANTSIVPRPSNSALITLSAVSGIGAVRPPEKMIHPALRTSPRSPS